MKKFAFIITLLGMTAFAASETQTTTNKKTVKTTHHTPAKHVSKKTTSSTSTSTPSESSASESSAPSSSNSSSEATAPSASSYDSTTSDTSSASSPSGSTSDTSSSLSDTSSSSPSGATTGAAATTTLPAKVDSSSSAKMPAKPTKEMVEKMVSQWPADSNKVAKAIIAKYGQPNEVTESMLIWKNNSPWKRTIVMRDGVQHMFPQKHMDVLTQFADYKVPVDKIDDLAQFDGSLMFDRTRGELAVSGDSEESNFLAINLAKEIIDGSKTVDAARAQFGKPGALTASANKDYVKGFKFSPSTAAADPDVAFKEQSTSNTSSSTGGVTTPSSDSSTNSNSTSDSPSTNSPEQR